MSDFPRRVEAIGLYPVDPAPWHLVELRVHGAERPFTIDDFLLPVPGAPKDSWQAPWDEHVLDSEGKAKIADNVAIRANPEILAGTVRFCFFMFVDSREPLSTPFGPVGLPQVTRKPDRLWFIDFSDPE